jgi:peptidoglycan/LPS O-acetylase OafA/YrhL
MFIIYKGNWDMSRINSLSYLKLIAAFAVIFFHAGVMITNHLGYDILPLYADFLRLGVIYFFTLSGFFMMLLYQRQFNQPKRARFFI